MNVQAASFSIPEVFSPATRFLTFGQLASDILYYLIYFSGVVSFAFTLVAGIKFVTSGGDPKKLAGAQATLTYALIGLVVTILSFVFLRVVEYFFAPGGQITPIG